MAVESHEAVDKISAYIDQHRAVHLRQLILVLGRPLVDSIAGRPSAFALFFPIFRTLISETLKRRWGGGISMDVCGINLNSNRRFWFCKNPPAFFMGQKNEI